MARRVERRPSRPDDVAGVHDGCRKAAPPCAVEQIGFDCRLLDAVLAERPARLQFGGRHRDARAVNPDRPGMQEMLDAAAERLDQLLGALQREADHVDDDVRLELADSLAEGARLLLGLAVERDGPHRLPGGMRPVGLAPAAADVDDLEPGRDEPRHQVGADVAAAADDHDTGHASAPIERCSADQLEHRLRKRCLTNGIADATSLAPAGRTAASPKAGRKVRAPWKNGAG